MTHAADLARINGLRARWLEYDDGYRAGTASRECVLSAYADWVDALDGAVHQPAFEARQGANLLRGVGVGKDRP